MGIYSRLFAALYDRALAESERAGLRERRGRLLAQAHGQVLEIGAGTGLNLEHYPPAVDRLVLAEPDPEMARRLERRLRHLGRAAEVVAAPAEELPFKRSTFDTVVATLVLCTVRDPLRALAEVRRVLVRGGELLFLEHVRSSDPRLARWQDLADPIWRRIGNGCRCNRDTLSAVESSGFRIAEVEHGRLPKALPIVAPLVVGRAVAR